MSTQRTELADFQAACRRADQKAIPVFSAPTVQTAMDAAIEALDEVVRVAEIETQKRVIASSEKVIQDARETIARLENPDDGGAR